jgi:hypothetical protein
MAFPGAQRGRRTRLKAIWKGLTKIRLVAEALREMNSAYDWSRVMYKGMGLERFILVEAAGIEPAARKFSCREAVELAPHSAYINREYPSAPL